MSSIKRYECALLILVCLCALVTLAACGTTKPPAVTPSKFSPDDIVQSTPTVSPFPIHRHPPQITAPTPSTRH